MEAKIKNPITDINQLNFDKFYTYADYLTWQFKERVELFKGRIHKMSPAPNTNHQRVSREMSVLFSKVFKHKSCEYFVAPFDVRLKDSKKPITDSDYNTIIQPDLCIICDESKLDEQGCVGSPDLVVEILSSGNSKKEMGEKFELYLENKIKEYWIVDPANQSVLVYQLNNNQYINTKPLTVDDELQSELFPELKFKVSDIF